METKEDGRRGGRKKKKKKMKFMFWNIRGLGALARRRQIRELIVDEKLNVIRLYETIK
jgi:hypothetical protein